jgi:hypothetical protein
MKPRAPEFDQRDAEMMGAIAEVIEATGQTLIVRSATATST